MNNKNVYKRNITTGTIKHLYDELASINIMDKINKDITTDPNLNYNTLEDIESMNKTMPLKKVKFNKYKTKCT